MNLYEAKYSHKDLVASTGAPDRIVQVWQQRDIFNRFSDDYSEGGGRRLFCLIDIFVLAVLHQSTTHAAIPPRVLSGEISIFVQERAIELFDKKFHEYARDNFQERDIPDVARGFRNPVFLICSIVDNSLSVFSITQSDIGKLYGDANDEIVKHPHIIVPVDQILFETTYKMFDYEGGEAPT